MMFNNMFNIISKVLIIDISFTSLIDDWKKKQNVIDK